MPRLKQPVPLERIALHTLHEYVVRYCDKLSDSGSLEDLRRGISAIKKSICIYMPWHLLADFCEKFLSEFCSKNRRAGHTKAALEIIMDIEISGLRCISPILAYVDPFDVNRFRRLQELDMGCFATTVPLWLEDFRLADLTSFTFEKKCTDLHLRIIGRECPKLEVLKVRGSGVTDEGLRALSPCSELRVVDIVDCQTTHSGINNLFVTHNKIERFAHWDGTGSLRDYDVLFFLDLSACQSLSYYVLENDRDIRPVHHLENPMDPQTVVDRFPNLTYLKINCMYPEDLSILKPLSKLTGLEVYFEEGIYWVEMKKIWESLKDLLVSIGTNVTTLKLNCNNQVHFWRQDELNFIFETCPNIENLAFDHVRSPLVVPPFKKLKEFVGNIPVKLWTAIRTMLYFEKMENLETLSLVGYSIDLPEIESLLFADSNFPKLSLVKTGSVNDQDIAEIKRTARINNLDFTIENVSNPDD